MATPVNDGVLRYLTPPARWRTDESDLHSSGPGLESEERMLLSFQRPSRLVGSAGIPQSRARGRASPPQRTEKDSSLSPASQGRPRENRANAPWESFLRADTGPRKPKPRPSLVLSALDAGSLPAGMGSTLATHVVPAHTRPADKCGTDLSLGARTQETPRGRALAQPGMCALS